MEPQQRKQPAATPDEFLDTEGTSYAASLETSRIGFRPPPFWPEEPELWFAQVEGQFVLANIKTDSTKFYSVIAVLEHRHISEVKDIITNPPTEEKYNKLKTELIKRLSASQERKVKQLLMHEELGDRKPSQFLRHLSNLAGPSVPDDFVKTLWSSRLPSNIQTIVASQSDLPLDKLADLADKIHELAPSAPYQVASTAHSAPTSTQGMPTTIIETMANQISELTKQVALLTTNMNRGYHHARQRSRSRQKRDRSRSRSRLRQPPENHPHCWYHFNFSGRAKKCQKPCQWQSENSMDSRK